MRCFYQFYVMPSRILNRGWHYPSPFCDAVSQFVIPAYKVDTLRLIMRR